MSDRQAFIDTIMADQANAASKLVFADWLEERGYESEASAYRWMGRFGKYPIELTDEIWIKIGCPHYGYSSNKGLYAKLLGWNTYRWALLRDGFNWRSGPECDSWLEGVAAKYPHCVIPKAATDYHLMTSKSWEESVSRLSSNLQELREALGS